MFKKRKQQRYFWLLLWYLWLKNPKIVLLGYFFDLTNDQHLEITKDSVK